MYAVIKSGGKQYRVQAGEVIQIEKESAGKGDKLEFGEVVLVAKEDGIITEPEALANIKVAGQVVAQGQGPKIIVYKYKRRKNYHRKHGHRQYLTSVRINSIEGV